MLLGKKGICAEARMKKMKKEIEKIDLIICV
jgi:hypothetical protein